MNFKVILYLKASAAKAALVWTALKLIRNVKTTIKYLTWDFKCVVRFDIDGYSFKHGPPLPKKGQIRFPSCLIYQRCYQHSNYLLECD